MRAVEMVQKIVTVMAGQVLCGPNLLVDLGSSAFKLKATRLSVVASEFNHQLQAFLTQPANRDEFKAFEICLVWLQGLQQVPLRPGSERPRLSGQNLTIVESHFGFSDLAVMHEANNDFVSRTIRAYELDELLNREQLLVSVTHENVMRLDPRSSGRAIRCYRDD